MTQSRPKTLRPRRRAKVQGQLKLWPTGQSTTQRPALWETLTAEQQVTTITALARLIVQTVCPEKQPPKHPEKRRNNDE